MHKQNGLYPSCRAGRALGTRQAGDVAILLTPDMARLAQPWPDLQTTPRQIALNVQDNFLLVNIYAPNDRAERELFFFGLDVMQQSSTHVILAGDFNCVQHPALDRLGKHSASRTKSTALDILINRCHLVDALDFNSYPDDVKVGAIDTLYVLGGFGSQHNRSFLRFPHMGRSGAMFRSNSFSYSF